MIFAGYDDAGNGVSDTEQWNGTNWTEVNNVNTAVDMVAVLELQQLQYLLEVFLVVTQ